MIYAFVTNTVLPIEGFTTFGINAKPNSGNPIGYFGTGLKYAVSIILRSGGKIRVLIDGTEYEFYIVNDEFRGKMFQKIRMKKRGDIFGRWRYEALPFTTELGKNWELWQAFRELESNTRDENGHSHETEPATLSESKGKTIIEVDCPEFVDVVNQTNEVFLDVCDTKVFENKYFEMYNSPSKYVYYRGVRVYDMRYPARFTYNFKQGIVELSEDRTARNTFMMFWYIAGAYLREIIDKSTIYKALNYKEGNMCFEGHDLSFSSSEYGISNSFLEVARKLSLKGFASASVSSVYYGLIAKAPEGEKIKVSLTERQWDIVKDVLDYPSSNTVGYTDEEINEIVKEIKDQTT